MQSRLLSDEVLRRVEHHKPLKSAEIPLHGVPTKFAVCLKAVEHEKDKSQIFCMSA